MRKYRFYTYAEAVSECSEDERNEAEEAAYEVIAAGKGETVGGKVQA